MCIEEKPISVRWFLPICDAFLKNTILVFCLLGQHKRPRARTMLCQLYAIHANAGSEWTLESGLDLNPRSAGLLCVWSGTSDMCLTLICKKRIKISNYSITAIKLHENKVIYAKCQIMRQTGKGKRKRKRGVMKSTSLFIMSLCPLGFFIIFKMLCKLL